MTFFDKIGWHPSIGDPTILGWLTVFLYALSAFLSFSVASNGDVIFKRSRTKQKTLWYAISFLFVFLTINKQLDLQTFFTASLRYLALQQDWYQYRRILQFGFILAVALATLVSIVILMTVFLKELKNNGLAILGIFFLLGFILIRASSFTYVDSLLGVGIESFRLNHLFEISGICLVAVNACLLLKKISWFSLQLKSG